MKTKAKYICDKYGIMWELKCNQETLKKTIQKQGKK